MIKLFIFVLFACAAAQCDLRCWLQGLTFDLGEQKFDGGEIKSFVCNGFALKNLTSSLVPPLNLKMEVQDLVFQCVAEVHVILFGTHKLTVTTPGSTFQAELALLKNATTGLPDNATLKSCNTNIVFSVATSNPIFQIAVDIIKFFYAKDAIKKICKALESVVTEDLAPFLLDVEHIFAPHYNKAPVLPFYGVEAMNLTGNPFIGLVDFLLDQLIGFDGPFNVNLIVDKLTNSTGSVEILIPGDGVVLATVNTSKLGNVTLGLNSVSASGLNTFSDFSVLVPREAFSLDSFLALSRLELNVSFFVSTEVGGSLRDPNTLLEKGQMRFSASNMSVFVGMGAGISRHISESLSFSQLLDPSCIKAAIIGVNLTQIMLGFNLENFLVVASTDDKLENQLDALIDNGLLLLAESYGTNLPAFINTIVLRPLVGTVNDALQVALAKEPCSLSFASSSAYPVNMIGLIGVAGGCTAAWIGISAVMCVLHFVYYSAEGDSDIVEDSNSTDLEVLHLINEGGDDILKRSVIKRPKEKERVPAIGLNPRMFWIIKLGIPMLLILNIALFMCSNLSVGASVYAYFHFGKHVIASDSIFSFTLGNSVRDMWAAGVYPLSLIVALFSGAWPYTKLLLMLIVWLVPMASKVRETFLMVLDVLGKWSLIDAFVLVFMMVAFRFNLEIPPSPFAQTKAGDTAIDVLVEADMGFYLFLLATMLSLILSHIVLAVHRWTKSLHSRKETRENVVLSLFRIPFVMNDGTVVRCTVFGALLVVLFLSMSFGLVVGGAFIHSFEFHFLGAAGTVFPYAGVENNRRFSLVSLALELPKAALNSNAFGVRWVQAVFLIFALVVPLCYLTVLVVLWLVPMKPTAQGRVFVFAEILRAWSAMEVFVLAVIAALTELEQFAQFLVGDKCDFINPFLVKYFSEFLNGVPKCFAVTTTLTSGCWLMFCACVLYILVGQVVMSVCHAALDSHPVDTSDAEDKKISRKARLLICLGLARIENK